MKKLSGQGGRLITVVLFLFTVFGMSNGCSEADDETPSNTPAPGGGTTKNEVIMDNMAFNPSTITVTAGTRITWLNNDSMAHTATSNDNVFDSGNIPVNGSYSYTFTSAGTYPYYCTYHAGMTGTVVVN